MTTCNDHDHLTDSARLALENDRLRGLLKRWLGTTHWRPPADEFERLCDDTKRALVRLGPDWHDDDE